MIDNFTDKNLKVDIFRAEKGESVLLPFSESLLPAGFPSSAENFVEKTLDLNDLLVKHPISTFYVRVIGDSMINAGISTGDILVVDRSLLPANNKIVVIRIGNEFTVKRLRSVDGRVFLIAENELYTPIEINDDMDFEIWGIVTFVIRKV